MSRSARIVAISARGAAVSGAWMGAAPGVVLGALLGAIACWLAAATLQWQDHLAFTLGVAANLLPFGDQLGVLQAVADNWWLVVPAVALAGGLAGALWGAFVGLVLALIYDRLPVARLVWVTLDDGRVRAPRRRPAKAAAPEGGRSEPGG